MDKKICIICKEKKNVSEFCKHKGTRDGLNTYCKGCKKQANRRFYLKNKKIVLERNRNARLVIRQTVLDAYGGKCVCCGEKEIEFLAIDHIFGGGNKEKKSLGVYGGIKFYSWLIKMDFPPRYRILCHNCNNALGFYGYCPHGNVRSVKQILIEAKEDIEDIEKHLF